MRRLTAALTALLVCTAACGDDQQGRFAGQWKTTFGPVTLEEKGDEVSGQIVAFKLPLKGKLDGKTLKVSYDEGQIHVNASLELEPTGHSFKGTFQASNGNRGEWSGWRPDPAAATSKTADFSGLWLTNLGLMELAQEGTQVKGRYAMRGTSSLEGEAKGRNLTFHVKSFRTGPGWFDLDEKESSLAGAVGTDGMAGWFGWKGRRAPEFVRHVPLAPGKIVQGSTTKLLTYSIHAPEGYTPDAGKKWPAIVILHGSNMNANDYVSTLAAPWPDIAHDYLILGINGETASDLGLERPTFNYTYVNYVGRSTYGGFPGTDRESPALMREALDELKGVYPIKHYFVGGHSQGGFLTYSLLMNSPEAIAGAFPVSAGVIFQCEPSAYADAKLKAAQRTVPLAIVHGKNDPMVSFEGGAYAYRLFLDAGWPAVRLFADNNSAHMFGRLPVGAAIRWLEVMTSSDPGTLLDFAEIRIKEQGYRDAIAAIRRARGLSIDARAKTHLEDLEALIKKEIGPKAKAYEESIRVAKDNSWVDGFLVFRSEFEYADAAAGAMTAFHELRQQHDAPASRLLGEARGLFQQGKRDEGLAKVKEIVEKYYASTSYGLAKKWLAPGK
jgi:predicted esterase